jgi:RNA polymerase sigma-70 factor (ECF subfamily)
VAPGFSWKKCQSQFLRHFQLNEIMNSDDQFEAIVSEYYEPLFRFALSLTRVESDAQDLTQQTFFIWATKGHQLRDISKVKTWLFTTLHRTFLNSRRKQIRFSALELEEAAEQSEMPSTTFADQEDYLQVLPALARVDEVYQAAVALFYLDNCSYRHIAVILNVPIGTVKSRIARGIAQLKEILQTDGYCGSSLNGGKSPTSLERALPCSHRDARRITSGADRSYEEWDLSATHIRELHGVV